MRWSRKTRARKWRPAVPGGRVSAAGGPGSPHASPPNGSRTELCPLAAGSHSSPIRLARIPRWALYSYTFSTVKVRYSSNSARYRYFTIFCNILLTTLAGQYGISLTSVRLDRVVPVVGLLTLEAVEKSLYECFYVKINV
jgi:hypothetical protein